MRITIKLRCFIEILLYILQFFEAKLSKEADEDKKAMLTRIVASITQSLQTATANTNKDAAKSVSTLLSKMFRSLQFFCEFTPSVGRSKTSVMNTNEVVD